jgi:hypothetical protein
VTSLRERRLSVRVTAVVAVGVGTVVFQATAGSLSKRVGGEVGVGPHWDGVLNALLLAATVAFLFFLATNAAIGTARLAKRSLSDRLRERQGPTTG